MRKLFLIFCMMISPPLLSKEAHPYGWERGYIDDVADDNIEDFKEFEFPPFPIRKQSSLEQVIFDKKLSEEFKRRYEEKFGFSAAERDVFATSASEFSIDGDGRIVDADQTTVESQRFAEFMLRRLAEYHADNYARNEPSLRKAYEIKERVSNVDVQVADGYKFEAKYSISGEILRVSFENPYVDTALVMDFAPDPFTTDDEDVDSRLLFDRRINASTSIGAAYSFSLDSKSFVWRRRLKTGWQSSFLISHGPNLRYDIEEEVFVVAGLGLRY
jgi:hypothetical protein